MKRTVMLMPDTHVPDHDEEAVDAFIGALKDVEPTELLILGDFVDCKAPARWSKATAAEYADTMVGEIESATKLLNRIRGEYDGEISFIRGNHEARIDSYINRYAPAVKGLVPALQELLDFDEHDIVLRAQPYYVAAGVVAIHGDLLSSVLGSAGQSAFKERVRLGTSVVQGHSHRLGLGWDRQERARFWMECGHLMDPSKAGYLSYGQANWQQGFGLLHVRSAGVFPEIHAIQNGVTV